MAVPPGAISALNAECSNSSWAEMETQIIGHFKVHPVTTKVEQIFIMKLLTPLAEYQEFLNYVPEYQVHELLRWYINIRTTHDGRSVAV